MRIVKVRMRELGTVGILESLEDTRLTGATMDPLQAEDSAQNLGDNLHTESLPDVRKDAVVEEDIVASTTDVDEIAVGEDRRITVCFSQVEENAVSFAHSLAVDNLITLRDAYERV